MLHRAGRIRSSHPRFHDLQGIHGRGGGLEDLVEPARSDYLRLGPLDRPAMPETLIRRIARLS
jgi:hypothetical protein